MVVHWYGFLCPTPSLVNVHIVTFHGTFERYNVVVEQTAYEWSMAFEWHTYTQMHAHRITYFVLQRRQSILEDIVYTV